MDFSIFYHVREEGGAIPVSYTHLDVYKRQIEGDVAVDQRFLDKVKSRMLEMVAEKMLIDKRTIHTDAVSYTQLDVDKRQDELLVKAGLIIVDERHGAHDKFWNRVMFPIMAVSYTHLA